ncbi:MAG TPA: nuclear transport factor 2 family protein [Planctomycetaceae bacterium]|nr:nuclear transport factor 2 family protein [Planctomycetaceae bacterium]
MRRMLLICLSTLTLAPASLPGQESAQPPAAETLIHQGVETYVKAFNDRDATALAAQWSPEAVYENRLTGEEVTGRAAIAEQFTKQFKELPDLKMEINVESIRLLSPNAAVEQGVAKLLSPKAEPEEVSYTALYVRQSGKWLLDRVTDGDTDSVPSNYGRLKSLEWLIGDWVDQDEQVSIETSCHWAKNQNFLVRSFAVSAGGAIDTSGMQVIGWDPAVKKIRSWTFDSDGGFAEATWTQQDDRWFIRNTGVLSDGRKASMVNVMRKLDDNSFSWQTIERTVGGELLPNINEVEVVRK